MAKGYCKICFKNIYDKMDFSTLLSTNSLICPKCMSKFKLLNTKEKVLGVETWFLYEYNQLVRKLIYQYKGCYDIELKDIFLYKFKDKIKRIYKGYTIIFPPSNSKEDEKRGYLHIEQIIKTLNMKYEVLFYKKREYKQSSNHYYERQKVKDYIEIIDKNKIKNIKYLIVDDIYTSGSTLKTIISLLIKNKVDKNNIKAIVIAKTIL